MDKNSVVIYGIGGMCNCDWFFMIEGILFDMVGCYLVYEEDCSEWFGFFGLFKCYCLKVLINGIIVMVSIVEFIGNCFEFVINFVKNFC